MLLQVLEEGSWSDAVDSALSKLNCKILDSKLLVPRRHEKVVNFPGHGPKSWTASACCFDVSAYGAGEIASASWGRLTQT